MRRRPASSVEDFPKTIDGLPALCETIIDKTGTLCDIRLTVNDLLAQMVYEGGVKVISDDGKKFTFDSPEAVAWLQMYVDMVKAGTVDNDGPDHGRRPRRRSTPSPRARPPFYQTGPNLVRDVKDQNPALYDNLAMVPAPLGKSDVSRQGPDVDVRQGGHEVPERLDGARPVLHQPAVRCSTSPSRSPIYPSTPASYDDPFFCRTPAAIEDSARPLAKDIISTYADIVPTIPNKADVNEIVREAVESALFKATCPPSRPSRTPSQKANALPQVDPPPPAARPASPRGRAAPRPTEPADGPMRRRLTATPYLFLAPALVLLGIFVLYPISAVVYYSFTDYDIVWPPVRVGLENYEQLCATTRSGWRSSTRSST